MACRRSRATGWSRSPRCRSTSPAGSWTRSRPAACPVVMLRGDGQMNPDGVRDYDLLVPASTEPLVRERHAAARAAYERDADAGGGRSSPSTGSSRRPATRESAPPAHDRRGGARRRRGRRRDRPGLVDPARASARTTRRRSPTSWPARPPSCGSSATTRVGRTGRWSMSGARLWWSRSSRCTRTRDGPPARASRARRRRTSPSACTSGSRLVARARRRRGDRPVRCRDGGQLVNDGPFTIWLDTDER